MAGIVEKHLVDERRLESAGESGRADGVEDFSVLGAMSLGPWRASRFTRPSLSKTDGLDGYG
jgi:hypothetical protein